MENERFELYLIRHGVAAERGDAYPDDTKRPLSSEGMQKLRRESKALLALDVEFDVMRDGMDGGTLVGTRLGIRNVRQAASVDGDAKDVGAR